MAAGATSQPSQMQLLMMQQNNDLAITQINAQSRRPISPSYAPHPYPYWAIYQQNQD